MGKYAEHVCIEPAEIRRIESLIGELPTNGHVRIVQKDGSLHDGVISERPNVQVFRDADEQEGINAVVRLDRPDEPGWIRFVWLDEIERVEHLDSTLGGES
jgi:hypothetical protein